MSSEAALGQRSVRATNTGADVRHRLIDAPAAPHLRARSRNSGDAYVPLIVMYGGIVVAADLLVAGLVTGVVAGRNNLVGVTVFVTVFTLLAVAAFWAGGRVVRRLPR